MGTGAAVFKGTSEKISHIMLYPHGGKDNGKFLFAVFCQGSLFDNLGSQQVVGQAVAGEDGKLLAPDQGSQAVNGGNTGFNIISWVLSGAGI